ncbi:MAG TPA: hypothetical protein EYQ85_05115 [Candidatus Poseidoniales archaeon]|nr:MAG: hypothetical protein CXT68_07405 [Euryarchaeota archaeon]HIF16612.1 hypothetical protein [Candidatus Poseidoniales archaeon]
MRRAIAMSLVLSMLVMIPATAEPSTMMQDSTVEERQPRGGEGNQTMRLYSDGAECWNHYGANDSEGMGAMEDKPWWEESIDRGLLEIDLWCDMDPSLKASFLLDSAGAFGGNIKLELSGSWENGVDDCAGNNNGKCQNLNISFYRGTEAFYREEITSTRDGDNSIQLNAPVNENITEFDGGSDSPQIRFEMVISGNFEEGSFPFSAESGEKALFRLYLENNSTVDWPILPVSWEEGFDIVEGGIKEDEDTPGFTTVLAMAAVAAGAVAVKRKQE